ncbi:formate dehydrogenase accessory sulfurtransferase FdhD [Neptunicella sp. SCSIO 80796]|uniref:formate dehydrogenase accessory sulfurtransferase FdhD n=1 Tax=Neptunicella plasticusilytica TaxID=3117012 RepID=UPI003A4D4ABC
MTSVIGVNISRIQHGESVEHQDKLAIEEPLSIHLRHVQDGEYRTREFVSTMRTPGDDQNLVTGLLLTCGVLQSATQIDHIKAVEQPRQPFSNLLLVTLRPEVNINSVEFSRQLESNSACGICGQQRIEQLYQQRSDGPVQQLLLLHAGQILALPEQLAQLQPLFNQTGGSHAIALFDHQGHIVDVCEDIGRHNAMDKLLGRYSDVLMQPSSGFGVLLSGRASYELLQKAAMLHIQMVVAIGAPSSLAVQVAEELDITLIGFVGNGGFNLYSGKQRVLP